MVRRLITQHDTTGRLCVGTGVYWTYQPTAEMKQTGRIGVSVASEGGRVSIVTI